MLQNTGISSFGEVIIIHLGRLVNIENKTILTRFRVSVQKSLPKLLFLMLKTLYIKNEMIEDTSITGNRGLVIL